ncbi:MAG: ribulose-phosphate 3-epimerase [Gaiellaceae bacterium]
MSSRELLASPQVAPSILSADFARLGDQVEAVMQAGARVIHVDVMDGHFVPPITIGDLVARSIQEQVHDGGGIVDVHLMIERPERQIAAFADAGADVITIHQEATPHVHYALKAVRDAGCLAGLAICPGTSAGIVHEVAHDIDVLLCMTVNPGWGGQAFIEHSVQKLERLKRLLPQEVAIEVDGGIDADTAPRCAAAGASMFVAGSAVFGAADPGTAYEEIERSVNG